MNKTEILLGILCFALGIFTWNIRYSDTKNLRALEEASEEVQARLIDKFDVKSGGGRGTSSSHTFFFQIEYNFRGEVIRKQIKVHSHGYEKYNKGDTFPIQAQTDKPTNMDCSFCNEHNSENMFYFIAGILLLTGFGLVKKGISGKN